jgi:ATP-dependent Lon protease
MESVQEDLAKLKASVEGKQLPEELSGAIVLRIDQLGRMVDSPTFLPEYDRLQKYIDWVVNLPWNARSKDVLDLDYAKKVLDKYHYGLDDVKDRILEYISVMKLKQEKGETEDVMRAPILCFVGLVGTGKTTIAKSIAEAMGRKFARIPFGGMGDPLDLRGQSRMHAEAEPGKVIKALRSTGTSNPVILLDEIDRVTDEGRSSIMGVLVELLDPEQNYAFADHYIDYPVSLKEVLFIATANNTHSIATAVMDRLEPMGMPSYTDQEKITIGQRYMLPKLLKASGIPEGGFSVDDAVWPAVVRPLGFDAGIRTLERNIGGAVRKAARLIIEGKVESVKLTTENIKQYLPQ